MADDLKSAIGEQVVTAGLAIVVVVLVAAILEPSPVGEISVGVITGAAASIAVATVVGYLFKDAAARKQLRRSLEDAIDDCKGKPGTPVILPTIDSIIKDFERRT